IPLKLKHYYQVATDISNAQRNHTFLENLALELIQIYGHVDSSKIPPTSAVTFEEFSLTYWTDVDVKEKFKSLLTTHVPMLRHLSSNNFYRYEYPVTDLSGLYQKTYDNMIIPLENAEGTEVSFDYFGWEPYVDINEGETKIKPAQTSVTSPLGVIPFSFTFQRYYTQYDVSFPVMVTVADQTAFAGEGYSLSFALEGTIINNAVPDENFAIKEEFTALKDSMLCDEQHLDTELIKTVVIDSYNQEPLELVQIGFSVPSQDNCIIGVTDDSGELETNYPPAYGGVVEFVKDEYLTNFYPIDTYEYTENPGIIGYAVAGYPQEVIELHKIVEVPVSAKKYEFSKCITHENGNDKYCLYNFGDALFEPNLIGPLATVYANGSKSWKHEFYLSDSPQQLGENETVTYTLIRRADLNPNVISEEYSTSFRVEGNQTTTIQLVPGIYEVTAAVITENAFNIPKNDRCEDSNCATISGMNITSFVTGVVNLDVETFYMEITPEDLYSAQEIEFYVFNYDLHKLGLRGEVANNVPALVLEDMMLISEMDQIGKNPLVRGLLEPVYK
ncbi:hypothetical protein HOG07_05040, partial [Candidatus Woesearchaeota archaeon]|nr:hypothetical protein [Candidatus Woesearchaeota archaeon]